MTDIHREVVEIRRAAEQMATKGDLFHTEVAEFLNAEALVLESADKGSCLRKEDDTPRALLIARAYAWTRTQQAARQDRAGTTR